MRIGSTRIAGFSRRFYIIIAAVILLIIIAVVALPKLDSKPPPVPPGSTPAYNIEPAALATPAAQKGGWIGKYISANNGVPFTPTAESDFLGANYALNVGLPMRFKAYISDPGDVSSTRPDLSFTEDGYTFEPAQFIAPNEITSLGSLASNDVAALTNQPVELGFRNSAVPPPDDAYEVTGLLWWRSDLLAPPSAADLAVTGAQLASPVVLVDSYEELSPEELQAPTTQRVDLNLNYQEDGQTVAINRIEWSAGNELRVCLSVTNDTSQTESMWSGVQEMTADNGNGTSTGSPDPNGALGSTGELQAKQSVPGYIDFPASDSDASQPLTLRMPTLNSVNNDFNSNQDSIIINVPTAEIKNVANIQAPTTNCLSNGSG